MELFFKDLKVCPRPYVGSLIEESNERRKGTQKVGGDNMKFIDVNI